MRKRSTMVLLLVLASPLPWIPARAQAWAYPSFQVPRITAREFNVGVADAGASGTSLVFQWREQSGSRAQLSMDAGLADRNERNSGTQIFLGGQYAYQLATSTADVPLDFLFTAGADVSVGDFSLLRLPVGVSLGHRFALDGGVAITPYIHPRVSLDICGKCANSADLGVNFDVGGSLELSRLLAIRVSGLFAGSQRFSHDGFGVALAWTPPVLKR